VLSLALVAAISSCSSTTSGGGGSATSLTATTTEPSVAATTSPAPDAGTTTVATSTTALPGTTVPPPVVVTVPPTAAPAPPATNAPKPPATTTAPAPTTPRLSSVALRDPLPSCNPGDQLTITIRFTATNAAGVTVWSSYDGDLGQFPAEYGSVDVPYTCVSGQALYTLHPVATGGALGPAVDLYV